MPMTRYPVKKKTFFLQPPAIPETKILFSFWPNAVKFLIYVCNFSSVQFSRKSKWNHFETNKVNLKWRNVILWEIANTKYFLEKQTHVSPLFEQWKVTDRNIRRSFLALFDGFTGWPELFFALQCWLKQCCCRSVEYTQNSLTKINVGL